MKTIGKKPLSFILSALLVFAAVAVPMPASAASISVGDVTIVNNAAPAKDVIHITNNLRVGDYVLVIKGSTILYTSTKAKGTSLRFEIPSGILNDNINGSIDLKIMSPTGGEVTTIQPTYDTAAQSLPPLTKNIIVTNNDQSKKGAMPSKVNVTGLRSGDVFYVYDTSNSATAGNSNIGVSGIASSTGTAEAKLKGILNVAGGSVWVTVKSTGRAESAAVEAQYMPVDRTTGSSIIVKCVNNYGSNDKVIVTGVYPSDQVAVYDGSDNRLLGSGRVLAKRTDIEISVKAVKGVGLNADGGAVWIKVTTPGKTEVDVNAGLQGPFAYPSESKSAQINSSGAAVAENGNKTTVGDVTIYRYVGKPDTVEINNLNPLDTVTVYTNVAAPQSSTLLKTIKVAQNATSVKFTMNLPGIAQNATQGSVVIYVASVGMAKSEGTVVTYGLPLQSVPLINLIQNTSSAGTTAPAITAVTNTALKNNDEIFVINVEPGDKIFIYANAQATTSSAVEKTLNTLNTGTVAAKKTTVNVKAEFPTSSAGAVYVSIAKSGQQESTRVQVDYPGQNKTTAAGITFTATNYAGNADNFIVSGAGKGTVITVYSGNGTDYKKTAIKNAYAKITKIGADLTMTFAFPALTAGAITGSGVLYVGVQDPGLEESDLVPVAYDPEPIGAYDSGKINATVYNNYGAKDYVLFTQEIDNSSLANSADLDEPIIISKSNLYPGHTLAKKQTVISIYGSNDPADTKKIGTLTIDGTYPTFTSGTAMYIQYIQRSVIVKDLNVATGGSLWYTFAYPGKNETTRAAVQYGPEQQTATTGAITVINNINTGNVPDYVTVTCSGVVTVGSIIKVYKTNDTTTPEICKVTVTKAMAAAGAVKISLTGKNLLNPNGSTTSGPLFVSVQMVNMSESDKVAVPYAQEGIDPTATSYTAIAIDNDGVNVKDVVFVYGLQPGDIVKLTYKVPTDTKDTVKTMTVGDKQSSVVFNMYIPDGYGWNGYLTVTTPGKAESAQILLNDSNVLKPGYRAP